MRHELETGSQGAASSLHRDAFASRALIPLAVCPIALRPSPFHSEHASDGLLEVALYPGAPRSYAVHPNCHTRVTPESHHSHTIITAEPTGGHFDLNSLD